MVSVPFVDGKKVAKPRSLSPRLHRILTTETALGGGKHYGEDGMRTALIVVAVLALCVGAYWATLPDLPPLTGVTRIELDGPRGRLREITQSDTVGRVVALAERHYPRWRSTLAPSANGGPLTLTFYRGQEAIRFVRFGGPAIVSCAMDACVAEHVGTAIVRELVDLVRAPRRLVDIPALDSAT